jgi:hypothetical protein
VTQGPLLHATSGVRVWQRTLKQSLVGRLQAAEASPAALEFGTASQRETARDPANGAVAQASPTSAVALGAQKDTVPGVPMTVRTRTLFRRFFWPAVLRLPRHNLFVRRSFHPDPARFALACETTTSMSWSQPYRPPPPPKAGGCFPRILFTWGSAAFSAANLAANLAIRPIFFRRRCFWLGLTRS